MVKILHLRPKKERTKNKSNRDAAKLAGSYKKSASSSPGLVYHDGYLKVIEAIDFLHSTLKTACSSKHPKSLKQIVLLNNSIEKRNET